jgi:DNA-binding response OmpR family regulator
VARIMLVDARVELHQYILKMLELAEHEVILVSSLSEALQNLVSQIEENREFLPDLLFVELGAFSVQDALEIHKKVRTIANTASAEIPMVFILQHDQVQTVHHAFTQAGIKFIVEPTSIDSLNAFLDNLRSVLDRLIKSSVGLLKKKNTTLLANLKEEHLPSILQMLSLVHASGYATLTNPTTKQTGSMHIRYGEITQIILVDPTSRPKHRSEGTEALQQMVEWSEGIFSFGRANPEKMPVGHPMTWVVLRCAKPKQ